MLHALPALIIQFVHHVIMDSIFMELHVIAHVQMQHMKIQLQILVAFVLQSALIVQVDRLVQIVLQDFTYQAELAIHLAQMVLI